MVRDLGRIVPERPGERLLRQFCELHVLQVLVLEETRLARGMTIVVRQWDAYADMAGPHHTQLRIPAEHVERIHGWYRDYIDVEGIARVVTLDEIAANDHNLNIPRYVEPKVEQGGLTVDAAMKRLRESAEAAYKAEGRLVGILKHEGLLQETK